MVKFLLERFFVYSNGLFQFNWDSGPLTVGTKSKWSVNVRHERGIRYPQRSGTCKQLLMTVGLISLLASMYKSVYDVQDFVRAGEVTADIFCHIGKRVALTRLFGIWPIYVRHRRVKHHRQLCCVHRDYWLVRSTIFYIFSSTIDYLLLVD